MAKKTKSLVGVRARTLTVPFRSFSEGNYVSMPWNIPHPVITETIIQVTASDRLFDQLVTAIGGTSGLDIGLMAHNGFTPQPNGDVSQVCFAENTEIKYRPSEVLDVITNKDGCASGTDPWWPNILTITLMPVTKPMAIPRFADPDGVRHLYSSICAYAFLAYYENIKSLINTKEKNVHPRDWISSTFRMAWIVRNAIGHRGKLKIDDSSVSANWRSLSLSSANNGEQLLYKHITGGDLILLMLDIEDLLS